jgi:hypothetical protein
LVAVSATSFKKDRQRPEDLKFLVEGLSMKTYWGVLEGRVNISSFQLLMV